ncbi:MAG: hypothetical protein BAA01_04620 [Bacillus thermozeamaize]|uniref:Major facilitator superfamily (MFS) profile domain-containing protein n=1 Tax=Bacillus thermozeamaize TaxID=230954 RepID=A0A1Y3PAG8_9BACI|nr:MAG: hypothetical protein BAA01_04620 [Bacillus thermozeamaize]
MNYALIVYATGFFSLGIQPMNALLVPLWAVALNAPPALLGLAVSAVSLLPILLSISSGALVDELGSKRVLLLCATVMALLAPLYPLIPSIYALIGLQLLFGIMQSMAWIASQTLLVGSKVQAQKPHAGTYSFASNLGTFIGPLLLGVLWDHLGPIGAFSAIAVWNGLLLLVASLLPSAEPAGEVRQTRFIQQLLPNWKDYRKAFSLLAIPAVVIVMYGTFLRLSSSAIRGSFYLVYLEQLKFSATVISLLYSSIALASIFSPLFIRWFHRFLSSYQLLFLAGILAILPLCLVPLFEQFWAILGLSLLTGFGVGMTLPLLISLLSQAVDPAEQGLAAGLREMFNRLAATCLPFGFGVLVEGVGLQTSFLIVAVLLLLPMAGFIPYSLGKRYTRGSDKSPILQNKK